MIIQALEWRDRYVEQWSSQGAMLGTALIVWIIYLIVLLFTLSSLRLSFLTYTMLSCKGGIHSK